MRKPRFRQDLPWLPGGKANKIFTDKTVRGKLAQSAPIETILPSYRVWGKRAGVRVLEQTRNFRWRYFF
jgi:hypothetical protein